MGNQENHVTVNIALWNGARYLDGFLKSLKEQTFQDFQVIVIDNASVDNGAAKVLSFFPQAVIIRNSSNQGFARAHNKGIEMSLKYWRGKKLDDRFIFIANQDLVLEPDCLEAILLSIYKHKDAAILTPKLLRLTETTEDDFTEFKKTGIIDSLGIKLSRSRNAVDDGAGIEYKKYSSGVSGVKEVFGASGAFFCARASALEDVKWGNEYFDEDFFSYKEDFDLSWRLRNLGWKILIDMNIACFHARGAKDAGGWFAKIQNERKKPFFIRYVSIRNHLWTLFKNDYSINAAIDFPFIFLREASKFLYCFIFDIKLLGAYASALAGVSKMLRKRSYLKRARVAFRDIRIWL